MSRISGNYGTHLGPLMACVEATDGPVLELGLGFFSTPYLHYKCLLQGRQLVSIDNDKGWVKKFASSDFAKFKYESPGHQFVYVPDWAQANIETPWDVVLVDHSPDYRRKEEIKRLANHAKYIIIHDSDLKYDKNYHYTEIYPLFRYIRPWERDRRQSTVLSNFSDLIDLW